MYHIDLVRKKFGNAISAGCRETKTQRISFKGMGDCVSVKGEFFENRKDGNREERSDCIVLCENDRVIMVALLELKSKNWKTEKVRSQLLNCYNIFNRKILPLWGKTKKPIIYRVAVVSESHDTNELRTLRKKAIGDLPIQTLGYKHKLSCLFARS